MGPGKKGVIMGLRDDSGQQVINVFVAKEDARRLLTRANALGWSRAKLLRWMIRDFLHVAEQADSVPTAVPYTRDPTTRRDKMTGRFARRPVMDVDAEPSARPMDATPDLVGLGMYAAPGARVYHTPGTGQRLPAMGQTDAVPRAETPPRRKGYLE